MKRRGKQPQNTDEDADDSIQADDSPSGKQTAKQKRSAGTSKSLKGEGGKLYKICGCALPWWQCLLAWGALGGLLWGVRNWNSLHAQQQHCLSEASKTRTDML